MFKFKPVWTGFSQILPFAPFCLLCTQVFVPGQRICDGCRAQLPWVQSYCQQCGQSLLTGQTHCGRCQQRPAPFNRLWLAFDYLFPVDQLIRKGKFERNLSHLTLLAELFIAYRAQHAVPLPQRLLPVPLHPQRLRERGYNQSLELARCMSRQWQIPLDILSVARTKNTLAQTGLSADLRSKNVADAFKLIRPITDRSVAIIDDVWTTGSTVHALCQVLRASGVESIDVYCLARARG